jgi:hypothetical protein
MGRQLVKWKRSLGGVGGGIGGGDVVGGVGKQVIEFNKTSRGVS